MKKLLVLVITCSLLSSSIVFANGDSSTLSEERRENLKKIISGEIKIDEEGARATAIYQLIGKGQGKDIPFILPYLENDSDQHVRGAIVRMLSYWGDDFLVVPALTKAGMSDSSLHIRVGAGKSLMDRGYEEEALAIFIELIKQKYSGWQWEYLTKLKKEEVREKAKKLLTNIKNDTKISILSRAYAVLTLSIGYESNIKDDKELIKQAFDNKEDKFNVVLLDQLQYVIQKNKVNRDNAIELIEYVGNSKDTEISRKAKNILSKIKQETE